MNTRKNLSHPLCRLAMGMGLASLSSCLIMGPDSEKPRMDVPAEFRGAPATAQSSIADLPWWDVMKDAKMKQLLLDTFANNRDLRSIMINVDTAGQYVTAAAAPLFPWFGYAASTSRGQNQSGGSTIVQSGGTISNPGSIAASASWEIDLWGKTARGIESADADYISTIYKLRDFQLSLMKQVATGYLELLMLDEQLRITREAVASYRKSLDLFTTQLEGGVGDLLQVESGRAALAASEAQIPDLESQIVVLENTLSVLAGRMPGKIARDGILEDYAGASKIPAGIPANVLAHRPDVLEAESNIRSANAKVGIAIANYFPSISLTSSIGSASEDLGHSLYNKFGWGMGASLTGPLFQGGTLIASENIARNNLILAVTEYEQTVLSAMGEVSSTLVSRDKLRTILQRQEEAVKAYRISVETSMERYKHGMSGYYEVLTAQQNLFPAEKQLAAYRYQYAASIPTLYTQLGGGWQNSNAEISTAKKDIPAAQQ